MADDKQGRDKQARDEEKRQRERDLATELERRNETEPPVEESELDDIEAGLESLEFPATGAEVVAAVGDRTVESADGTYAVAELVPDTDGMTFDSPAAVRTRVRRPSVAGAMKRVVEASETLRGADFSRSKREAYERTFRGLEAIDADDDDEGIRIVGDWITDRIHDEGKLPKSRDVRRRAAKFCRANGYKVRDDEWLGV